MENNRCEVASTVEHAILLGNHDLTIDEKGRLLIPVEFRRALEATNDGANFVLVNGIDGRIWLYPERVYKAFVNQRQQDLTPSYDRLDFEDIYFGMANPVESDKQGRVLIPEKMLKDSNINRDVTVRGAGTYMKIWNRADWEARKSALQKKQMAEYAAIFGSSGLPDAGEVSRTSG